MWWHAANYASCARLPCTMASEACGMLIMNLAGQLMEGPEEAGGAEKRGVVNKEQVEFVAHRSTRQLG